MPLVGEESARVARLSLQYLEGLAKELIEDDWDLDEALWVLAEACRAAPELQHKAGLYRRGGVVGVLGGATDKPLLTKLMNMVLSAVAPTAQSTPRFGCLTPLLNQCTPTTTTCRDPQT